MPRLVGMQTEYEDMKLSVLGVTDADRALAQNFSEQHQLNFDILAEAPRTREAFGVQMVWGSTHYLVDPSGVIVAKGLDGAEEFLDQHGADSDSAE